jgi:hypothetical protein
MAKQVSFDEWFDVNCLSLSGEARRLMQMSWNGALTNGDRHFFVDDLAQALQVKQDGGTTWNELILEARKLKEFKI